MRRRGRAVAVTVAGLALASAGMVAALAMTSASAAAHSRPCHGVRVAKAKRFGWWMYPAEEFSRSWVCGHFGAPRAVRRTRTGVMWRYGRPGPRALTFVRESDGRFSTT